MFPNRPPNSIQPSSHQNAKEMISELCDRIKGEYTSMYSHIQSLKSELDKANSQRADYERYYTLNHDMNLVFSTEAHKMTDVIKRLVQACMQQVPFLPPDLQNSCVHLIEQVKHYTSTDPPNPPPPFMQPPPPGVHPQQQPPPHHMQQPPHNNHMGQNMPPPHGGMPPHMMPPPHMHPGQHMQQHNMMSYMPRGMPPPPPHGPIPQQHYSDSREMYPGPPPMPPGDMYRYPYRESILPPQQMQQQPMGMENINGASNRAPSIMEQRHTGSSVSLTQQPVVVVSRVNGVEPAASPEISPTEFHDVDEVSEKMEAGQPIEVDNSEVEEEKNFDDAVSSPQNNIHPNNIDKRRAEVSPINQMAGTDVIVPNKPTSIPHSPPRHPPPNVHPYDRQPGHTSVSKYASQSTPKSNMHGNYYAGGPKSNNGSFMGDPTHGYPQMGMPHQQIPPHYIRPLMPPPGQQPPSYDHNMMPRGPMMPPNVQQHHQQYYMPPHSYPQYLPSSDYVGETPYAMPPQSGVPRLLHPQATLSHGEVVCASSFSDPVGYVFTGTKGTVKIWDINEVNAPKLLSSFDCLNDHYVRSCKSVNNNRLLIVCGESSEIGLWNLTFPPSGSTGMSVNNVGILESLGQACYDMAITPDQKRCYVCCDDGSVIGYDIETQKKVHSYSGHSDGATCISICQETGIIWSGGLDGLVRSFDERAECVGVPITFPTQVFSLAVAPSSEYVLAGLENKTIEMCNIRKNSSRTGERQVFKVHDSCVLTVKISHNGKWLFSSSKDNYTNCARLPTGQPQFVTRETSSVLCTDISPEDKYVITGSGDKKATIYECSYMC